MIQYKETKKLYQGKYQHRIVLIGAGVHVFRGGNLDGAFKKLSALTVQSSDPNFYYSNAVKTQDDLNYLFDVYSTFSRMTDFTVRVETPWLSVYTNDEADIISLKLINKNRVKAIYKPKINLSDGEVVSTLPYDYKVSIKAKQDTQHAFIEWAKQFDTIRLPNSCVDILTNGRNWHVESYFYVKGDKTLTMAQLHLGGVIKKIERIVTRESAV